MTSVWGVPSFDLYEYLQPGFRLGFAFALCDEVTLQRGEETFQA